MMPINILIIFVYLSAMTKMVRVTDLWFLPKEEKESTAMFIFVVNICFSFRKYRGLDVDILCLC